MFLFKAKSPSIMPQLDKVKDKGTQEVIKDINKIIQDTVRDVLDDLKILERVEKITALPAAAIDNLGKFLIVNGTGTGADNLYIGLDTGSNGYKLEKIPKEDVWANYSTVSTIVGWSSFTTKQLYTKKIGNTVFVSFYFLGTSNSTVVSFTLPYAMNAAVGVSAIEIAGTAQDNGVGQTTPGRIELQAGSSTAYMYKDFYVAAWTASGSKQVIGSFFYESV